MIARYHPSRGRPAEPFRYKGPEDQLADRLARLARHRLHVVEEIERIERFLAEHPKLRGMVDPADANRRPRLVVDNAKTGDGDAGHRRQSAPTAGTGPSAA